MHISSAAVGRISEPVSARCDAVRLCKYLSGGASTLADGRCDGVRLAIVERSGPSATVPPAVTSRIVRTVLSRHLTLAAAVSGLQENPVPCGCYWTLAECQNPV